MAGCLHFHQPHVRNHVERDGVVLWGESLTLNFCSLHCYFFYQARTLKEMCPSQLGICNKMVTISISLQCRITVTQTPKFFFLQCLFLQLNHSKDGRQMHLLCVFDWNTFLQLVEMAVRVSSHLNVELHHFGVASCSSCIVFFSLVCGLLLQGVLLP